MAKADLDTIRLQIKQRLAELKAAVDNGAQLYFVPPPGANQENAMPTNSDKSSTSNEAVDPRVKEPGGIEAPFTLSADNVVDRIDNETGATIHEIVNDEKVLFSTLSKPLAFAFVTGWNSKPIPGSLSGDSAKDRDRRSARGQTGKDGGGKDGGDGSPPDQKSGGRDGEGEDPSTGSGQAHSPTRVNPKSQSGGPSINSGQANGGSADASGKSEQRKRTIV